MKKKFLILPILLFTITSFSQQISDGFAPTISDFNIPLKSGIYSGLRPTGIIPDNTSSWQHLFVMRYTDQSNNHQLQISSSFSTNDRLFFRKIVSLDLSSQNQPWIEIATRGANTFTGNQIINGNVGIGTSNPQWGLLQLDASTSATTALRVNVGGFAMNGQSKFGIDAPNIAGGRFIVTESGNIGIGIINPLNKLDVNGTIHSKEVKVDMIGWSDFVFKKEYNLPTLAEVEKHINEKGHLENIPNEEEVLKNGINLGEMNTKLLQKIEELTLYMINQNKSIEALKEENKKQNEEIMNLKKTLISK